MSEQRDEAQGEAAHRAQSTLRVQGNVEGKTTDVHGGTEVEREEQATSEHEKTVETVRRSSSDETTP